MPKNFKKLLVCIVATFGITAMVFSCCKKVGLCASDSTISFNPPPLLYSNGIANGGATDTFLLGILDDAITRLGSNYNGQPVVIVRWSDGKFRVWFLSVNANDFFDVGSLPSDFTSYSLTLSGFKWYSYNANGTYASTSGNSWNRTIDISTVIEDSYYITDTYVDFYPLYIYHPEKILFSNGTQVFATETVPVGPIGHSKGGVLSNYIDSDDLIESSSDLPKVDTTPPADTSSNSGWFQKILNGIGKVNQSIQGGILTLGDFIGSGFEKVGEWFQNTIDSIEGFFGRVVDKLDDVIDSIEGLFDGTTVSQAQTVWQQEFNNSVFKDFVDLKSTIETDILTPIKNANAPSSLSFTIPLISVNVPRLVNSGGHVSTATNNVYLFGQSVTLDFSWYTRSISGGVFNGSSIRDYLVPIIATFLYVGMVVHLLFKIPSFLSGSSGFSNTLHSVVVSNNGSKFKKA